MRFLFFSELDSEMKKKDGDTGGLQKVFECTNLFAGPHWASVKSAKLEGKCLRAYTGFLGASLRNLSVMGSEQYH